MTARQEAYHLIDKMPDDTVIFLVELLKRMRFASANERNTGTAVQFGLGKGQITDPAGFDLWDAEIAAAFEGISI